MHYSVQSIQPRFKRVPAVDKTFAILNLLDKTNESMGVNEITRTIHPCLAATNPKTNLSVFLGKMLKKTQQKDLLLIKKNILKSGVRLIEINKEVAYGRS